MTVIMGWVFYSIGKEDEDEEDLETVEAEDSKLVVNDFSESKGRLHTLYCENCRKKKRHREIRPRVFECTRCKRNTDLRIPS
jgi:hypothetical protein